MRIKNNLVFICYTIVILVIAYLLWLYNNQIMGYLSWLSDKQIFKNIEVTAIVSLSTFVMTIINFRETTKNRRFDRKVEKSRIKELQNSVDVFRTNKIWNQNISLETDDIKILKLNIKYILRNAKSYTLIHYFDRITLFLEKIESSNLENRQDTINDLVEYVQENITNIENRDIF
ncbi:hypothetical protein [Limosilactobacillus reuteri]|uniref:hypothetical protein n=1 Tax=Limosilactobacillus reuteri TaxID=1598 RepID=UPI000A2EAA39|nr:hypothetical protein [Limosilactobacillus reuteri]OTA48247.1 hypothetical protein BHL90_02040 [Limosilactobacillus reuteri]